MLIYAVKSALFLLSANLSALVEVETGPGKIWDWRFVVRLISYRPCYKYDIRRCLERLKTWISSYLRFYFEFVFRHPDWLEQGWIKPLLEMIESRFEAYVGNQVYEEWVRQKMGARDLASLRERCRRLDRIQDFKIQYALFSKSGFVRDIQAAGETSELLLFEGSKLRRL